MGGGDTTSTVTQSNLPAYARPYFESMMNRTLAESERPYEPYTAQRLTGMSDATTTGLGMGAGFAASEAENMPYANFYANSAGATGTQIAQNSAFNPAIRDYYMSPYMDAVTDRAKTDAAQNWLREKQYRDAEAVKAGAFGGTRAAVKEQISAGDLQNRLSNIDVQGRQAAFENAQQQYERDRGASLQGAQLANQSATTLGDLQASHDQMMMDRIKTQLGIGQTVEDYRQQQLDMAYNDFVNQRDVERQNLQFLSSVLRGVPISANQNVTQSQSTNPLAGILAALGGTVAQQQLNNS